MAGQSVGWQVLICFLCVVNVVGEDTLTFQVAGPGLHPDFELPVRYFTITAYKGGERWKYPVSPPPQVQMTAVVQSIDARNVPHQLLNLNDGTYVVRFKLIHSLSEGHIKIVVTRNGLNVAESPYVIEAPLYGSGCHCPVAGLIALNASFQCPSAGNKLLLADLEPLRRKGINVGNIAREMQSRLETQRYSFAACQYIIEAGDVYRRCFGEHVDFKMFVDQYLYFLVKRARLPDMSFVANLGDWPLSNDAAKRLPIVSWCGSGATHDVILPTYDLVESSLEMMGRVSLDVLSVLGHEGQLSWKQRDPRIFWRGRDSRVERLNLVRLAKKHPDKIDARLTHVFFFRDQLSEFEPLAKPISFMHFFKYRYQLNIDGTVAAYRLAYLLAGGSTVFKTESQYYEHFYGDLEEWVHYIPVKADLSDLLQKYDWAEAHPEKAEAIAIAGREFALSNLLPHHVMCYHVNFFHKYSQLVNQGSYERTSDFVKVDPPPALYGSGNCDCKRGDRRNDEL